MEAEFSVDPFLRGAFHLVQPRHGGHRAGMDALVLAAAVEGSFAGSLVDFGAGAGAVGLAVAARCPAASVTLVENSPEMAHCARLSIDHDSNRHLLARVSVVRADVTAPAQDREAAGLVRNTADFIVMNPPFNEAVDRATPDTLRRAAHVMKDGLFDGWLRSAAAIAKPRARVAIIARPVSVGPILSALTGRFGGAEMIGVHARPERAAIRIVIRARRGSRGGLSLLPPLVLHEGTGNGFTARAEAINAGLASLFGD